MRIQTILNRVEKFKSFVYGEATLEEHDDGPALVVQMVASQEQSAVLCSGCGRPGPAYDRLEERRFEFVPIWGILVFLAYRMRRVNCKRCGVTVEMVPWCDGKNQLTTTYRWYPGDLGQEAELERGRLDLPHVVGQRLPGGGARGRVGPGASGPERGDGAGRGRDRLGSRAHVFDAGLRHRRDRRSGCWPWPRNGPKRACGRAWTVLARRSASRCKYVCSDMWKPYLNVIAEKLGQAVHVLDRFHVMQQFGKALDEIRAEESKRLVRDGYEPVLKKSRWCFLKRPENLTDKQTVKLSEVLKYNLRTVRAYLLREEFQRLWEYKSAWWAGKFLDEWTGRVMRSRLEPMKKIARSIRTHRPLILNWFRARGQVSAGAVEGLNNKVKLVTRKSYGFRTAKVAKLALLHNLGHLPEPKRTHRFC